MRLSQGPFPLFSPSSLVDSAIVISTGVDQPRTSLTECFYCHFQSVALQTALLSEETDLGVLSLTNNLFHKAHKSAF